MCLFSIRSHTFAFIYPLDVISGIKMVPHIVGKEIYNHNFHIRDLIRGGGKYGTIRVIYNDYSIKCYALICETSDS